MPSTRAVLKLALSLVLVVAAVHLSPAHVVAAAPAVPAATTPAPTTPAPTNTDDAKAAAAAAAAEVAQAQAQVKQQVTQVELATQTANRTQAAFQAQLVVQAKAQQQAVIALIRAAQADAAFAAAFRELRMVVAQQYESGGVVVDAAHLLVADDPSGVLSVLATQQQIGDYESVLVERAQVAREASIAAHNRANAALLSVQAATQRAKQLRDTAAAQLDAAHQQLLALREQLTTARASQAQANAVLSSFLGGWVLANPALAAALNEKYMRIAASVVGRRAAPSTGRWSDWAGESAVWRALQEIGLPYAWAGGGTSGPSRGVCAKGDAHLDCYKVGFDCSGLTMYGWGPYLSMPHYAATQYSSGLVHPTPSQLKPGDLVFWSTDKTVKGIHHVAMYVGDGNVIQAPNSGDIVRITPLGSVASGYFGATRPLT
jgi:cell wall-associated NlpC family hydrolase